MKTVFGRYMHEPSASHRAGEALLDVTVTAGVTPRNLAPTTGGSQFGNPSNTEATLHRRWDDSTLQPDKRSFVYSRSAAQLSHGRSRTAAAALSTLAVSGKRAAHRRCIYTLVVHPTVAAAPLRECRTTPPSAPAEPDFPSNRHAGAAADAVAAAEALQRGDWGTAWRRARAAAAGGAESPDVLAVRGIALARLGCFDDAESCLRDALTQACC